MELCVLRRSSMFLAKCEGLDWDEHQDWTGGKELPALPEPLHFSVPDFLPGIKGDPVLPAAFLCGVEGAQPEEMVRLVQVPEKTKAVEDE